MTKTERKSGRKAAPWHEHTFNLNEIRLMLVVTLGILLTVIIIPKGGFIPDHYQPGDIASRDIKAPRELLVEDQPLTEKKRQEAQTAVLPLYDFDSNASVQAAQRLEGILSTLRATQLSPEPDARELLNQRLAELTGSELPPEPLEALLAKPLKDLDLARLREVTAEALQDPIVGNLKLFQVETARGLVLRDLGSQKEFDLEQPTKVIGIGQAMDRVRQAWAPLELPKKLLEPLAELTQAVVRPNLTYNRNATEERRQQAYDDVPPVLFQVKKGEMIVREGDRVTAEQVNRLRAISQVGKDFRTWRTAIGLFLSIVTLFVIGHHFARSNIRKFKPDSRDLLFLALTYVGFFFLVKIAIFIASAVGASFTAIDASSYWYLIPFAMGSMLVRLVLNSEVALMFALTAALLVGLLFGNNLPLALFALVGSLVGAHGVQHCKTRTTLYRSGLHVALVNLALIFAIHLLGGKSPDVQLLYKLLFGGIGGLLSAVMVNGTVPLVETVFKYTTDIKLLEMANLNTPILRELMIQAPGTYHHSVVVGNLVEAAAEKINANPLLARVAAYYHDIGKIRKPLYFIENADGAANRHDKLAPSMSALILTAHVKDGIEMARESKLGQELIDIIQQHHGTSLIKFFYDKAKNQLDPGVHQVKEDDYRYPGPKPQTREAALIMLADAVEAASRTLSEPTPARIQGMVQKIINNIFIDGQLDECELTLKDLHSIAKSFNRILSGIFHNRVDYPEPAYKERDKDAGRKKDKEAKEPKEVKETDDSDREPAEPAKDRPAAAGKGGAEDLKRLGMS